MVLQEKFDELNRKWELRERHERKNNIVIRGVNFFPENQIWVVEEFLRIELGLDVRVAEVWCPRGSKHLAIAKPKNWNDKQEILRRKSRLGTRRIFIEPDMSKAEQEIQRKLRLIARQERAKGVNVRLGHQRIQVNDRWMVLIDDKLTPARNQHSKTIEQDQAGVSTSPNHNLSRGPNHTTVGGRKPPAYANDARSFPALRGTNSPLCNAGYNNGPHGFNNITNNSVSSKPASNSINGQRRVSLLERPRSEKLVGLQKPSGL